MSNCDHTFHRLGGIDDCPVCNPSTNYTPSGIRTEIAGEFVPDRIQKPTLDERKFREFWVRTKDHDYKDVTRDMDRLCLDYEPDPEPQEVFTHVIEYAAIAEMQAEIERLKSNLEKSLAHWDYKNARIITLKEENKKLREALEKIAEAERMGYGTQRTYGEIAIKALEG